MFDGVIMEKKRAVLKTESIYNYLRGKNDHLDHLLIYEPSRMELAMTDQSLYEAIGAMEDKSKIDYARLVKLLENAHIIIQEVNGSRNRSILTEVRAFEIRANADEIIQKYANKYEVKKDDPKNNKTAIPKKSNPLPGRS